MVVWDSRNKSRSPLKITSNFKCPRCSVNNKKTQIYEYDEKFQSIHTHSLYDASVCEIHTRIYNVHEAR